MIWPVGPTAESNGASAGSAPSSSAAPGSAGEAYPSAAPSSGGSAPSGSTRGWERSDGRPRVSSSTPVIAGLSAACSWRWRRARGSALIGGSRRGALALARRGSRGPRGAQISWAMGSTPCSISRFKPARARSTSCPPRVWPHWKGLPQPSAAVRPARLASSDPCRGVLRRLSRSR